MKGNDLAYITERFQNLLGGSVENREIPYKTLTSDEDDVTNTKYLPYEWVQILFELTLFYSSLDSLFTYTYLTLYNYLWFCVN